MMVNPGRVEKWKMFDLTVIFISLLVGICHQFAVIVIIHLLLHIGYFVVVMSGTQSEPFQALP